MIRSKEILFIKLNIPFMKRILVPTDFSSQAENALKVAAQLARKFNAEIFCSICWNSLYS